MTVGIQIKLKPNTSEGRLYPLYDKRVNILSVESRVARAWPFGITIDGRLSFDIDERRILANFDLIGAKRTWKSEDPPLLPEEMIEADLEFDESTLKQKSFNLDVKVTSKGDKTWAYIEFGPTGDNMIWVKLSDTCFAQVIDNQLRGFFVSNIPTAS